MFIVQFLGSTAGRLTRAIAGLALIVLGISLGGWWWLLAIVGAGFIVTSALDLCPLAPLFGKPVLGRKFRTSF